MLRPTRTRKKRWVDPEGPMSNPSHPRRERRRLGLSSRQQKKQRKAVRRLAKHRRQYGR